MRPVSKGLFSRLISWVSGKRNNRRESLTSRRLNLEKFEDRVLLTIAPIPHPVVDRAADDSGLVYSSTGPGWESQLQAGAFRGGIHTHAAGSGTAVASESIRGLAPNVPYEILATYQPSAGLADNVPYTIFVGATQLATVRVNQQQAPSGDVAGFGQSWESIGVYTTDATGNATIQVSDNADGPVSIDAVRAARVGKVQSLTASRSIVAGDSLTLTAQVVDPSGTAVQSVAFYHDANQDGTFQPESDELLGVATDGTNGWSIDVASDDLPEGDNAFFAQSSTSDGVVNWATTMVNVLAAPAGQNRVPSSPTRNVPGLHAVTSSSGGYGGSQGIWGSCPFCGTGAA